MALPHHKSVSKVYRDAVKRMDHARERGQIVENEDELRAYLEAPGKMDGRAFLQCGWLGHLYGAAAVEAYANSDRDAFSDMLHRTVGFKTLELRLHYALSATIPDTPDNRPQPFEDGINAAGPFSLSLWPLAEVCAECFLWLADKDQRLRIGEARRMSNGTTDAFLVYLFSNALARATSYKPDDMLEDCYKLLLDQWRTTEQGAFQEAMAGAIDFHIRRSKYSTDHTHFEFDHIFEMAFAMELLAVMALRKRLGLPNFATGHALVDGPWEVIQSLPRPTPYPLIDTLEARLKKDYPTFI